MRRKNNRYARRPPTRSGERVLIVVEGETEKAYFIEVRRFYRLTGAQIEIYVQAEGTDPKNLRNYALTLAKNTGPFDEIWLVYDLEAVNHERRKQANTMRQEKKSQGISFAESDPSFEFWLILHFEYTSKSFSTPDEVIRYLKIKYWPNYTKGCKPLENMLDKIPTACQNAQQLREFLLKSQTTTPKTDVDELIKSLSQKSRN